MWEGFLFVTPLGLFRNKSNRIATKRPCDCQQLLETEEIRIFKINIVSDPKMHQNDSPSPAIEQNSSVDGYYCYVLIDQESIELRFQTNKETQRHDLSWFIKLFSICWLAKQKTLELHKVRISECHPIIYCPSKFDFYVEYTETQETDENKVFVSKTHSPPITFEQPWVQTIMLDFDVIRPYVADSFNKTVLNPLKVYQDYRLNKCVGLVVTIINLNMNPTSGAKKKTYTLQFEKQIFRVSLVFDEVQCTPWYTDYLYQTLAKCMTANWENVPIQSLHIRWDDPPPTVSLTVRFTVEIEKEKRISNDDVFTLHGLPDSRVVLSESLRDLMVRMNVASPYTHKSFYSECITALTDDTTEVTDKLIQEIGNLWMIGQYDLQETTNKTTLPQILAQHLDQGKCKPQYKLYSLIQAMVFCGAFTVPYNTRIIPDALQVYEQKFNLASTFNSVYYFLHEALVEKLIPPLVEVILSMLELQIQDPHCVVKTVRKMFHDDTDYLFPECQNLERDLTVKNVLMYSLRHPRPQVSYHTTLSCNPLAFSQLS